MVTFLSGAGGAALVAGVFALIQWVLNRHAKKQEVGRDADPLLLLSEGVSA